MSKSTWHEKHSETLTIGDRWADFVASGMGSWNFIFIQTCFVVAWMLLNIAGLIGHWDPYPFILLNLIFSTQAAYAAPIIMMSQNRQSQRDRMQAQEDYRCNIEAKKEIEELKLQIIDIEKNKLDRIIQLLDEIKKNP
jgi:uncharacterized membrane protein